MNGLQGDGAERRWRSMRALLEFLGIAEPDRSRREPVALPASFRWALRLLVPALAVATTLVYVITRTLLS